MLNILPSISSDKWSPIRPFTPLFWVRKWLECYKATLKENFILIISRKNWSENPQKDWSNMGEGCTSDAYNALNSKNCVALYTIN